MLFRAPAKAEARARPGEPPVVVVVGWGGRGGRGGRRPEAAPAQQRAHRLSAPRQALHPHEARRQGAAAAPTAQEVRQSREVLRVLNASYFIWSPPSASFFCLPNGVSTRSINSLAFQIFIENTYGGRFKTTGRRVARDAGEGTNIFDHASSPVPWCNCRNISKIVKINWLDEAWEVSST